MNTCKTCKYWEEQTRAFARTFLLKRVGACNRDRSVACLWWVEEGFLYTYPDFGCVLHESLEV